VSIRICKHIAKASEAITQTNALSKSLQSQRNRKEILKMPHRTTKDNEKRSNE
jgi:hypothetical protein